jgi:hypothetical protein
MIYPKCPECRGTKFSHLIDEAHGISGTYMDKTERFVCRTCGIVISCNSPEAKEFPFQYEKIK